MRFHAGDREVARRRGHVDRCRPVIGSKWRDVRIRRAVSRGSTSRAADYPPSRVRSVRLLRGHQKPDLVTTASRPQERITHEEHESTKEIPMVTPSSVLRELVFRLWQDIFSRLDCA